MPVISTHIDTASRAVTIVSELNATPAEAWELWSDAKRLANWWGPPELPMIVTSHELRRGATTIFYVSLPDDTVINARFDYSTVRPHEWLAFVFTSDGLEVPTDIDVAIELVGDHTTRMTIIASYRDDAALQQALAIGVDQGLTASVERADRALQ